tara:strand:+ start:2421 stop:2936 length:516 start_codon:yes stop_codon:yes gene_type:complete
MSVAKQMWNRLMMLLVRGIVSAVQDDKALQTLSLDLLADESKDGVERFQDYGFTTHPPTGLEALVAFVGGNRSHGIVLAVGDRKFRLRNLASGEVALYDDQGQKVYIRRDGILVESDFKITLRAPQILIDGAVHITGATTSDADIAAEGVSLEHHTHGGVDPGAGHTSEPD